MFTCRCIRIYLVQCGVIFSLICLLFDEDVFHGSLLQFDTFLYPICKLHVFYLDQNNHKTANRFVAML